ncbi:recombination protein RecR [Candidatus Jorgensenbacteria bacterium CG10_big_fil_rev_8_21_14_0_10_54_38]|uniref:Recombination protein RecR n=2 Tax=Candidatus Joergenseniibacteriota TaxID=1752739 RepID=A0A2M6WFS4_9BACT|nr:MAG: recombination protein RecR [Candidatus Jorgensenbacteria bacterium CG23_combo_of_CG06-09_8_20_14_all_54_14]PIT91658.1 MAG: recombination protein RecR [Candidatus Jorgensenbacteria bacterium CG10_big_fil_rev_8_21_14_0_10_54_38]
MLPASIKKFIEGFSKLPSLGPRLATRLAFYLLNLDRAELASLIDALGGLKRLNRCPRCFFFKEANAALCTICANPARATGTIAVVERETDLLAIEKTGKFGGQYLILGELPEKGIFESTHKLRLAALKRHIGEGGGHLKELIIALSPTSFGDFAADVIGQEFKGLAEKITRLGRGIPTGGEIEFADEETLSSALERRS